MAPKLLKEPLVATIKERVKAHRAAPPSAQRIATVHRILGPEPAPAVEPDEPMAKKKAKNARYPVEYKAKLVARALKAKETGEESIEDIAKSEGIHGSNIHNWIAAAKKANGSPGKTTGKADGKAPTIRSLSKELEEALDRAKAIKKQLRKLLDVD